jgi:hypothetical protein
MPIDRDDTDERRARLDMLIEQTKSKSDVSRERVRGAHDVARRAIKQAKATDDRNAQHRKKKTG